MVLVAIAVTSFDRPGGRDGAARRGTRGDAAGRHPAGTAVIEELRTTDGNPALPADPVTEQVDGRDVTTGRRRRSLTTGQAQAFVVFPGAGALGVVSRRVCPDAADLDRAAVVVAGIAARMTVIYGMRR